MDNDLVEFAMRCPIELKLSNLSRAASVNENDVGRKSDSYFSKTNDGKLILREVMSRYIPETVTSAVKQGFSSPDASWFKGESIRFVSDRLLDKHSPLYEILSFKAVSAALNEHFQGNINRRLLIWSLLSVDEYVRQHSL
jgi:asparagine synthase (glutamine-hydrolysing)